MTAGGTVAVAAVAAVFVGLTMASSNVVEEKSCDTPCSEKSFPHCGVWLQSDNEKTVSGVYGMDQSFANLTCTISSLPRPAHVRWLYQTEAGGDWTPVTCSSKRTVSDCKFNEIGEHSVTSVCLLKIDNLDQSGVYQCVGSLQNHGAESRKMQLQVYGVANVSLLDDADEIQTLTYGQIGHLRVRVCAHPKPEVVWIHSPSGRTVTVGSTSANVSASHLHFVVENGIGFGPARVQRHCYAAKLLLGRVEEDSHAWTVVAWNSVDTKRFDVVASVVGIPAPVQSVDRRRSVEALVLTALFCTSGYFRLFLL